MVFHWSLGDNKSPKVSRNLLSILADLNNAVVKIISARPLSSKFNELLGTVPIAPTKSGITVTFMFHNFLSFLERSKYLCLFRIFLSLLLLLLLFI